MCPFIDSPLSMLAPHAVPHFTSSVLHTTDYIQYAAHPLAHFLTYRVPTLYASFTKRSLCILFSVHPFLPSIFHSAYSPPEDTGLSIHCSPGVLLHQACYHVCVPSLSVHVAPKLPLHTLGYIPDASCVMFSSHFSSPLLYLHTVTHTYLHTVTHTYMYASCTASHGFISILLSPNNTPGSG